MQRRHALGLTAATAIGFALGPTRLFAQASAASPIMDTLSTFMSSAATRPFPPTSPNTPSTTSSTPSPR